MLPLDLPERLTWLSKQNRIPDYFQKKNKTALDLGCGFNNVLFKLYHFLEFNSLTGVDKLSADEIIQLWNTKCKTANLSKLSANSIYNWYKNFISLDIDSSNKAVRNELLNENEFNKTFKFHWNTDIATFCKADPEKYDLVILSNVLHLITYPELRTQYLNIAMNKVFPGGLFYLKVNHPGKIASFNAPEGIQYAYSDEEFLALIPAKWQLVHLEQKGNVKGQPTFKEMVIRQDL